MARRQPGQIRPPNAEDVIVCPSCGKPTLAPHCTFTDRRTPCGWLVYRDRECRSYGIPGVRWCDMRRPAAA